MDMKLLCFFWFGCATAALAQQPDSVRVEYMTETAKPNSIGEPAHSRRFKALYRRFIRAQIKETTLIKVAGLPYGGEVGGHGYWGINSQIGVEQKLSPAWSVYVAVPVNYRSYSDYGDIAAIRGGVSTRWYYSMLKRMRLGRQADNFSSQYVGANVFFPVAVLSRRLPSPTATELSALEPAAWLSLNLGMQRRLGKYAFFDLSGGPLREMGGAGQVRFQLNFTFGFGL